ncbi:MAG: lysophospholipid acyltransferase family protein [Dongiaceae bacterium]
MEPWQLRPAADHGLSLRQQLTSLRRESGLIGTCGHLAWQGWIRSYLRLYHRLAVSGRQLLPAAPPIVLVANHSSHLDALTLSAALPLRWCDRVFPIAAADTFFTGLPSAGFAVLALNALPLQRRRAGPAAIAELRRRLVEERAIYILFPEGTRSRDGRMAPFKPGLGPLIAGTDVPVVPCRLEGTFAALPPHRRWPRPGRLALTIGEPLRFAGTADDRAGWEEIAAATEAAVRGLGAEPPRRAGPA